MEINVDRTRTSKVIDRMSWALFFIFTGVLFLFPSGGLNTSVWLIGTGTIILASGFVKGIFRAGVSGFQFFMGFIMLIYGIANIINQHIPFWPSIIILLGVVIIFKAVFDAPHHSSREKKEE